MSAIIKRRKAIIALLAPLGLLVVWNTASIALLDRNPSLAAKMRPGNELVLSKEARLSVAQMAPDQLVRDRRGLIEAEEASTAALAISPFTPGALGMLVFSKALLNKGRDAKVVSDAATSIGKRDRLLLVSRVMMAASKRDAKAAVANLDSLARVQRNPDRSLFPLILQLSADETFRPHMADLLARRPHWRSRFFVLASQETANSATLANLIDELADRGVRLDESELATFFIVNRSTLPPAEQLRRWSDTFLITGAVPKGPIRDAEFTQLSGPPPYSWTIGDQEAKNAWIQVKSGKPEDKELIFITDGADEKRIAYQYINATAGVWQFSIEGRVAGMPKQALRLKISCVPSGERLAETEAFLSDKPSRASASFRVPDRQCDQQDLSIYALRNSAAEPYEIFLDNAHIGSGK